MAETDRTILTPSYEGMGFIDAPIYQDGVWNIKINTTETDWVTVVTNSNHLKSISGFHVEILPDSEKTVIAAYVDSTCGLLQQEFEIWLNQMQQPEPTADFKNKRPIFIGHYNTISSLFFPEETSREKNNAVFTRFKYSDGTYDSRYVLTTVSFTDTNPVSVTLPQGTSATPSIPVVSVPQTGDSFPLFAVCLCALLALAAIGYFSRKALRS